MGLGTRAKLTMFAFFYSNQFSHAMGACTVVKAELNHAVVYIGGCGMPGAKFCE